MFSIFKILYIEELRIGNVDIKSSQVHFYVQRNDSYSVKQTSIPFEHQRLNIGGAMNLKTGTFTAPRDGIYHFHFSAKGKWLDIYLKHNGVNIGHGMSEYFSSLSIHATLELKKEDTVNLWLEKGDLHDPSQKLTYFTGWLFQEDLIHSLSQNFTHSVYSDSWELIKD